MGFGFSDHLESRFGFTGTEYLIPMHMGGFTERKQSDNSIVFLKL